MPAFGVVEIGGGTTALIGGADIGEIARQRDRDRTTAPEELEAVQELSEATKVYIYSVGAWPQQIPMGSLGTYWVQSLPEDRVLVHGDLSVSQPLIVPGVPSEPYPGDGEGRRLYHKPPKSDPNRRHTGYHLALEIIGAADKSSRTNDLRQFGLFVSTQPEQKPDSPTFPQWKKDVEAAQQRLRAKLNSMCADATQAWKNGTFKQQLDQTSGGDPESNRIFVAARVLKKTKVDCPWLENTVASADNKECIAQCGRILPAGSLQCQCGVRQVTDAVYDREIKRRQESAGDPTPARGGSKKAN